MITFLYKNLIDKVSSISENSGANTFGTEYLHDHDINSVFRGADTSIGTTTILFSFGSAVYMDSVACVTNLTSIGTLIVRAGVSSSVAEQAFGVPLDGLGTSHKFFGNYGYQFWRLDLYGVTGIGKHQVNEVFLGKRLSISQMPTYPMGNSMEEDTIELISERGQKWVYSNFERENWVFNFESVNATTENDLYKMYRYCGKNTQPFFMNLNLDDNANNIKYARFKENSFLSEEITKNTFDISLEIESEV